MPKREPHKWPDPIHPQDIQYSFRREKALGPLPSDAELERRFRASPEGHAWLVEYFGETEKERAYFQWNQRWFDIPWEIMAKLWSFDDLLRIWLKSVIMSEVGTHFEKQHPLIWKVQNCLWQYGGGRDYDGTIAALEGLARLDAGLPDFEVRVIHTRGSNTHAWAEHIREVYLDGAFGLAFYYKGKHVFTVGFAFADEGILISQVQLREKKGNRFLYHLPKHYLDLAIDTIQRAFPQDTLWLVTGASAVHAITRAYQGTGKVLEPATVERIAALYERSLDAYHRVPGDRVERQWRTYVRLQPKHGENARCA